MILKYKNRIHSNTKAFLFFILFFWLNQKTSAQEFDWVYAIKGIQETIESDFANSSRIEKVVTNSNNEIYALGNYEGTVDFGEGVDGYSFNGNGNMFILKMDENKNIIWIKRFFQTGYYLKIEAMVLDGEENIILGGYNFTLNNTNTSLVFDPNYHPVTNPDTTNVHENLSQNTFYGFVLKLDSQGNFLSDTIFESIKIKDVKADNNNNIVAVGFVTKYLVASDIINSVEFREQAFIGKYNSNLNPIWEKTFPNPNGNNKSAFFNLNIDSQNNIYCMGTYLNNFEFGDTSLTVPNSAFICKILSNGDEVWIIDLYGNLFNLYSNTSPITYNKIEIDNSNNIFFSTAYDQAYSYLFANTTISNLPVVEDIEQAIFKIDVNGNHIWNIPMYGNKIQETIDFTINSQNELIVLTRGKDFSELFYVNNENSLQTNGNNVLLLKINGQSGNLIDYKGIGVGINPYHYSLDIDNHSVVTDTNDNILLSGYYNGPTDFDISLSREFILTTNLTTYIVLGEIMSYYVPAGYILKLKNCESLPFFGDTYEICSGTVPNPTIADIKDSGPNIKFYTSMASTTPLSSDFPLIHGQTLYYENIVSSCSNIGRFPVQINILPKSNPPIVSALQPCFYQELQLADIDVQGQNVLFYLNPSGGESVNDNLYLNPNMTYYVTQNYNNCESNRVPFSVYQMTLLTDTYTATVCDQDKNDTEMVNLTDYLQYFTGSTGNGFSGIYFNSHEDALNNQNAISNVETFTASNQTVFIRLFSTNNSCFEIVELNLSLVYPTEITEIKVDDLVENNTVTIFPYDGNFVYSLDGITFQSSNVFSNVSSGEYYAYMKDVTANCSSVSDKFYVLSYPKFFTPNGDGINDFWRIRMSQFQYSIDVEIYDRFGKFITNFDKNSGGWDGKHKGKEQPATDYWFKIIKTTNKETIYHGHFSLIR